MLKELLISVVVFAMVGVGLSLTWINFMKTTNTPFIDQTGNITVIMNNISTVASNTESAINATITGLTNPAAMITSPWAIPSGILSALASLASVPNIITNLIYVTGQAFGIDSIFTTGFLIITLVLVVIYVMMAITGRLWI